jgi:uncharacterized protein YjbJ (UPF0337 family)
LGLSPGSEQVNYGCNCSAVPMKSDQTFETIRNSAPRIPGVIVLLFPWHQLCRLNAKPNIMNSKELKLKGNWNTIKGKIKQQYAHLSDDDLKYEEGKDDELVGRLQNKIGKTKEEVIEWIQSL